MSIEILKLSLLSSCAFGEFLVSTVALLDNHNEEMAFNYMEVLVDSNPRKILFVKDYAQERNKLFSA